MDRVEISPASEILDHAQTPSTSPSKPSKPILCLECDPEVFCGRKQEYERHILTMHLPPCIQCPHESCPWRGSRKDELEKHMAQKGQCGTKLEPEEYEIYNTKLVLSLIRKDPPYFKIAEKYALDLYRERAKELGKEELWKKDDMYHQVKRRKLS